MSQANEVLKSYLREFKKNALNPLMRYWKNTHNLLNHPQEILRKCKHDSDDYHDFMTTVLQNAALLENKNRKIRMILPAVFYNEESQLDVTAFNKILDITIESANQDWQECVVIMSKYYKTLSSIEEIYQATVNDYVTAHVRNQVWIKMFQLVSMHPEIFLEIKNFMNQNGYNEQMLMAFTDVVDEWTESLLQNWEWSEKKNAA
jgi:hypothetical protein